MNEIEDERTSIGCANGFGNLTLYKMCFDQPLHNDKRIVASKAEVIAKFYEVSRNLGSDYQAIAGSLIDKELQLDKRLQELQGKVFCEETVDKIVSIHRATDENVCRLLRASDSKREVHSRSSFVSKYLHFHQPSLFPILDSWAEIGMKANLDSRLPAAKAKLGIPKERYERFVRGLWLLKQRKKWQKLTLRGADTKLMALGKKQHRTELLRKETGI